MIKKEIRARRDIKIDGETPSESVTIKKGDVGELLSTIKTRGGYTIVINDKTLTIKSKRVLLHYFKV